MTVFENHGRYDASNVEFAGHEIKVYDKKIKTPAMHHIDIDLELGDVMDSDEVVRYLEGRGGRG